MNSHIALISFCLYMTSINSLKCWRGAITSEVNVVLRSFTDIPSGNLCYSFTDETSGDSSYAFSSPTQISDVKKLYDVKECSTDFCNEPPNPHPM